MSWTTDQQAALAREYARIGIVKGDLLPAPAAEWTADETIAFLKRIASDSGRSGFIAELGRSAGGPPPKTR